MKTMDLILNLVILQKFQKIRFKQGNFKEFFQGQESGVLLKG